MLTKYLNSNLLSTQSVKTNELIKNLLKI